MDKYGVDTDPDEKTAEEAAPKCPDCGAALRPINATGVRLCPKCGSKPFEKKERP